MAAIELAVKVELPSILQFEAMSAQALSASDPVARK
ncbi:hypothetical protein KIPB_013589, partial [Kipferlia bialata]|eukprot:g13589.t1